MRIPKVNARGAALHTLSLVVAVGTLACGSTTPLGGDPSAGDGAPPAAEGTPQQCKQVIDGAICPLAVRCESGTCVGTSGGVTQDLTPTATCETDGDCVLKPCGDLNPCEAWVYDGKKFGKCVDGTCKIDGTFYTAAYNCVPSCSTLNLTSYNTDGSRVCSVDYSDPSTYVNCILYTSPDGFCQINRGGVSDPNCLALCEQYRETIDCVPQD